MSRELENDADLNNISLKLLKGLRSLMLGGLANERVKEVQSLISDFLDKPEIKQLRSHIENAEFLKKSVRSHRISYNFHNEI